MYYLEQEQKHKARQFQKEAEQRRQNQARQPEKQRPLLPIITALLIGMKLSS